MSEPGDVPDLPPFEVIRENLRAMDDDDLLAAHLAGRCDYAYVTEQMKAWQASAADAQTKADIAQTDAHLDAIRTMLRALGYEVADRTLEPLPLPTWSQRVTCDDCGAGYAQPCRTRHGNVSRHDHKSRYNKLIPLYVIRSEQRRRGAA